MSRHSEGSFGNPSASSFSPQGNSGSFHFPSPHHRTSFNNYPFSYPYPVPGHRHQHYSYSGRGSNPRSSPCYVCITVIVGIFLGSLFLLFGFYGNQNLEMGPYYSRVLTANSFFVKEIVAKSRSLETGPILYGFSKQPNLDHEKAWEENHEATVLGNHHQEWAFWLNKGSEIRLKYKILVPSVTLLIVVVQGKENFNKWIQDPYNFDSVVQHQAVQEEGTLDFRAEAFDDYYFALGNLHFYEVKVKLQMLIHSKVYNTENSFSHCPLSTEVCSIKLTLLGSDVALIATPDERLDNMGVWFAQIVYRTRWVTYCVGYGMILLILAAISICSFRKRLQRVVWVDPEAAPLVSSHEAAAEDASHIDSKGSVSGPDGGRAAESTARISGQNHNSEISDENLCIICFEDRKESFFDPCGHCVTCYSCGCRIKDQENPVCPICRQYIRSIRRIFLT